MTSCYGALKIDEVLAHGHIVVTVFFIASDKGTFEEGTPYLLPPAKFIEICDCNAIVYCTACFEKVMVETAAFNFVADWKVESYFEIHWCVNSLISSL